MRTTNRIDSMPGIPCRTRRVARGGLLCAMAMALSFLEGLLPPVPFFPPGAKPGLSNVATMYAAFSGGLPDALAVSAVKSLFAAVTRGPTAGIMSLAGGLLSAAVTWSLWRLPRTPFGFAGMGMAGALCHNIAQWCVALLFVGPAMRGSLPFLILFSLPAGALTGLIVSRVKPLSRKRTQ